jgi:hypothetical protein
MEDYCWLFSGWWCGFCFSREFFYIPCYGFGALGVFASLCFFSLLISLFVKIGWDGGGVSRDVRCSGVWMGWYNRTKPSVQAHF